MDKTIEERAKLNLQYEKDFLGRDLSDNMVCRAYVEGATEQKAIDNANLEKIVSSWKEEEEYWIKRNKKLIDKAWQWMVDWVFENAPHEVFDELMSSREEYIKAMEE